MRRTCSVLVRALGYRLLVHGIQHAASAYTAVRWHTALLQLEGAGIFLCFLACAQGIYISMTAEEYPQFSITFGPRKVSRAWGITFFARLPVDLVLSLRTHSVAAHGIGGRSSPSPLPLPGFLTPAKHAHISRLQQRYRRSQLAGLWFVSSMYRTTHISRMSQKNPKIVCCACTTTRVVVDLHRFF